MFRNAPYLFPNMLLHLCLIERYGLYGCLGKPFPLHHNNSMVVPDRPRHLGIIFQPCAALNNLIIYTDIRYNWQLQLSGIQIFICNLRLVQTGRSLHIEMLMNYGYDSLNCFTLILCGEPHLNNTLRKPVHEALRQRITVHYNFTGLTDSEVAQYVLHKISCAGGSASIIEQAALSAVHSHSQGNPRLVDNLMTNALTLGAQMEKKAIDTEVILASVSSQNLG